MSQPQAHGFCQTRFEGGRDAFAANLARGEDVGASFFATLECETVVHLSAGWARSRP